MTNLASMEKFAQRWLDTGRALNIMCNNAGMRGSPGGTTPFMTKEWRAAFQVWLTEFQHRLLQHDEFKHIVNGCHPGYVNSGIWNLSGERIIQTIKELVVQTAAGFLAVNPQQGSLTITHTATSFGNRSRCHTAMIATRDCEYGGK